MKPYSVYNKRKPELLYFFQELNYSTEEKKVLNKFIKVCGYLVDVEDDSKPLLIEVDILYLNIVEKLNFLSRQLGSKIFRVYKITKTKIDKDKLIIQAGSTGYSINL